MNFKGPVTTNRITVANRPTVRAMGNTSLVETKRGARLMNSEHMAVFLKVLLCVLKVWQCSERSRCVLKDVARKKEEKEERSREITMKENRRKIWDRRYRSKRMKEEDCKIRCGLCIYVTLSLSLSLSLSHLTYLCT
ncbi:hypothetical protein E2C01_101214 [Portunus trituberculatus]|uniref:Uncharacterized protein n=1 Tax=Portunus trituberculatus TaxID=210409 RepID=A0A5B7KJX2_PORTR|nr:hypothetical protein [Portunus trituberculatus]